MRSASEPSSRTTSTCWLASSPSKRECCRSRPNLKTCCPSHSSFEHRQRLDELQAADVALLAVEEVAALALRRVDHRQVALRLLVDLERAARRPSTRAPRAADRISRSTSPGRKPFLRERRRRLRRAERRQRRVGDLAREVDDAAGQRMPRREHRIEPRERIEAVEPELRLARQALDRRPDEAVLQVLAEQQAVALERARDRQPRLELVDEGEPLAEAGHEVARLDDSTRWSRAWSGPA